MLRRAPLGSAAIALALFGCGGDGESEPTEPAPTTTGESVDAPRWETYASPLGFAIRHPPDWVVEVFPPASDDLGDTIWLMDPAYAQARDDALAANDGLPSEFEPPSGSSKVELVAPLPNQAFDADYFAEFCETRVEPSDAADTLTATITTISDREAVICEAQSESSSETIPVIQWVDLPNGEALRLTAGLVEPSVDDIRIATELLSTLSFDDPP